MKYGINYQGSKNAICVDLCSYFPIRQNFYDLFAGGCAVTHRILEEGRFENVWVGDVNPLPVRLFLDCVEGKVPEPMWYSREEFERVKDTDPYAACLFSFGGDWQTYLYGKDIEALKKAFHDAVVDRNFEPALALGYDLSPIGRYDTWNERRLALKRLVSVNRWEELQHLERLVHLERIAQLMSIKPSAGRVQPLFGDKAGISYDKAVIRPDSVIYCDIPYKGTKGYKNGLFSHDNFYDWCRVQTEPVFISEYDMPSDFVCVGEFGRQDHKSAKSSFLVTERLFIPGHQRDMYEQYRTTLF